MHCVFHAFLDHLQHLKLYHDKHTLYTKYIEIKAITHETTEEMTSAVVVPYLYERLLSSFATDFQVMIQLNDRYVSLNGLYENATKIQQIMFHCSTWMHRGLIQKVEQITLEPAIYCMLGGQHAHFGTTLPNGKDRCFMAFQFKPIYERSK